MICISDDASCTMMEAFKRATLLGDYAMAKEMFPEEWPEGATVLHVAAMMGQLNIVAHLLSDVNFDVNLQDTSGWTPLMHALSNNHQDVSWLIIKSGKCDVSVCDSFEQTYLHFLAQCQGSDVAMADYFLLNGVQIDAEDKEGSTAFLRAIETHHKDLARHLHKSGCNVHSCNLAGQHALHISVYHLREDLVSWLLDIGCSVNCQNNLFQTPLMLCTQNRSHPAKVFHMLRYLVNRGSQVNVQDCQGNTALLLALGNPSIIKKPHIELLLMAGANPNIPNKQGLTPIWQAVYDGLHYPDRIKIIQLLLYQNCYTDMSCRGKLLFTSGVDSVYCYENFLSPLEVALDSGYQHAAKMLVHAGCQVRSALRGDMKCSEVPAELTWFQNILENPPSLKHKSRLVIRRILGETINDKVRHLPLPETLKDYVLLRDLVHLEM